ncbi:MAG: ABC transporter ATP-binding protein/permease [Bacilli bacterium]|nr:ABC transporter ATP-binding protein/permease [Bacilli bacterium]
MADGILVDKKIPLRVVVSRTLKYASQEKGAFIGAFILLLVNVFLGVLLPRITGYFTDHLTSDVISMQTIIIIAVASVVISIVNQGLLFWENMILTKAGQKIVYKLRMEVFEHIESMSQNQFNEMPVGSLVTRVCNYTSQLSAFFTNVLVSILRNVLTIVVVYIWMMVLSWQLGLILFGVVIIVFVISFFFSKIVHKLFSNERKQISAMNTYINESLSGMKIIQIFNQEQRYAKRFFGENRKYFNYRFSIISAFSVYRPLISFIYIASVALILSAGIGFGLTAGTIVAFYLYLGYFFQPVQNLADQLNNITRAMTAIERLFNLLDIPPEVLDVEDAVEIDEFKGKIEFRNVYFAYEKENWVLKDVSFVINPKETAAFVGATGSGKTTILGLIVRNFEAQKGEILIDDIDIKKIKISSLRRAVGQMLQEVFLFTGSIKDNITLFDEEYSDEEVYESIDYVNAGKFIRGLPEKINTKVIEKGENFSAGQRQLLSFARTVLHKPQIMILDEATANIDTETEVVIQKSLENIKNIGTMLVVAHRLSTIQHSDKIFVLAKGEIIERGNHQELLKQHGYYYKLYKLQFENN